MFSPVPPTDAVYINANFPQEMGNGQGVIVRRSGTGPMGQDVLDYIDFNKRLKVEMWAYRADDVEKIGSGPPTDFWQVDLLFSAAQFAADRSEDSNALFREVAPNVAECLLRWPKGRVNPSQAKSVRVRAFDMGPFTMDRPPEWAWIEPWGSA